METLILLFVVGGVVAFILYKTRLPDRAVHTSQSSSVTQGRAWHDAADPKAPHFEPPTHSPPTHSQGLGVVATAVVTGTAAYLSRPGEDEGEKSGDGEGSEGGGPDPSPP